MAIVKEKVKVEKVLEIGIKAVAIDKKMGICWPPDEQNRQILALKV